jgi:hypothetical protein
MWTKDTWFFLVISAIGVQLRLVGDIKDFSNAKTVVIFKNTYSPN